MEIKKVLGRFREVWEERREWETSWKGIRKVVLPFRGFFEEDEIKNGRNRARDVLNGTAMRAIRTLAAGLQSGVTSPACAWFRPFDS